MSHIIIILSAFIFSGLTFFSGFGLATVLTPVFILFFPVPIAISLTAVVHFLNNIFKLLLVGRQGNIEVIIKFGLPAMLGAYFGSSALLTLTKKNYIINYNLFNHEFHVQSINLIIGVLILIFAFLEMIPQSNKIAFNKNWLAFGGIISGFFGGLSGHQGAFRSVFLLKCNLTTEQFIATGILAACLVDIVRLSIYGANFWTPQGIKESLFITFTVLSAFLGSYLASKYMKKVTVDVIKNTIVIMLLTISAGLITGLI